MGPQAARKKCITIVPGYNCNTRKRQFRRIARVVAAVAVRRHATPPRSVGRGLGPRKYRFCEKRIYFLLFTAPPVGENENAFGGA